MNIAHLEGYIGLSGKYDGERTTATGKTVTSFSLACPTNKTGNDGKKVYEYFRCECWHDEYGTQNGIVDRKYAHIECVPRQWKSEKSSGVSFTVRRIWHAPEREGNAVMNAVSNAAKDPSSYVSDDVQQRMPMQQNEAVYEDDIPF